MCGSTDSTVQSADARISGMVVEDHASGVDSNAAADTVTALCEQTAEMDAVKQFDPAPGISSPISSHRLLWEPPPLPVDSSTVGPLAAAKQDLLSNTISSILDPSHLPGFCESSTQDTARNTPEGAVDDLRENSYSEELAMARCRIDALESERMRMLNLDVRCRVLQNELQRCQAKLAECEAASEQLRVELRSRTMAAEEAEKSTGNGIGNNGKIVSVEVTRVPSASGQLVAADDFCSYLDNAFIPNYLNG